MNVILIEHNNGEQWEDYHKWVEKAFLVSTEKNAEEIHAEWKAQIVDLAHENDISVNPNFVDLIMDYSKVKSKTKLKTLILKNNFESWLIKNYNAQEIAHSTLGHLPRCLMKK